MLRKLGLFLFLFSLLLVPTMTSGYDYTGTIRENGDQYWDDNEITFIDFD